MNPGRLAVSAVLAAAAYELLLDLNRLPAGHSERLSYYLGGLLFLAVITLSTRTPNNVRRSLLLLAACAVAFIAYPVLHFVGFFVTIEWANS